MWLYGIDIEDRASPRLPGSSSRVDLDAAGLVDARIGQAESEPPDPCRVVEVRATPQESAYRAILGSIPGPSSRNATADTASRRSRFPRSSSAGRLNVIHTFLAPASMALSMISRGARGVLVATLSLRLDSPPAIEEREFILFWEIGECRLLALDFGQKLGVHRLDFQGSTAHLVRSSHRKGLGCCSQRLLKEFSQTSHVECTRGHRGERARAIFLAMLGSARKHSMPWGGTVWDEGGACFERGRGLDLSPTGATIVGKHVSSATEVKRRFLQGQRENAGKPNAASAATTSESRSRKRSSSLIH